MSNEVWIKLNGMDDYEVSSLGRVRRFRYDTWRVLSPEITRKGYLRLDIPEHQLSRPRTRKQYVHLLVATHFVPIGKIKHSLRLLTVDHIDENKANNSTENLRWLDRYENRWRDKGSV